MTDNKYAEGPWYITTDSNEWYDIHDINRNSIVRLSEDHPFIDGKQRKELAHLISAAPEMRDILQELVNLIGSGSSYISYALEDAEQILTKTRTGEYLD